MGYIPTPIDYAWKYFPRQAFLKRNKYETNKDLLIPEIKKQDNPK